MVSGPGLAPEWSLYAQQLLDIYNEFPDLPRSQVDGTLVSMNELNMRGLSLPRLAQLFFGRRQRYFVCQPLLDRVSTWCMPWPGTFAALVDYTLQGNRAEARRLRLRAARCRLLLAQAAGAAARAVPWDVVTLVARHLPAAVRRSYLGKIAATEYRRPSRDSESRKRRRQ